MSDAARSDGTLVVLHERVVLRKFDGDLSPEQCETATPFAAIVFEDGEVVDRWTPEEDRPYPE